MITAKSIFDNISKKILSDCNDKPDRIYMKACDKGSNRLIVMNGIDRFYLNKTIIPRLQNYGFLEMRCPIPTTRNDKWYGISYQDGYVCIGGDSLLLYRISERQTQLNTD